MADRVLQATNLVVAVAPPVAYYPSASGVNLGHAYTGYILAIDTTGLNPLNLNPAPLMGDFAVEFLIGGVWTQETAVAGALVGPYGGGSKPVTMIWTIDGPISLGGGKAAARIRVDRCPGYTFPSVVWTFS